MNPNLLRFIPYVNCIALLCVLFIIVSVTTLLNPPSPEQVPLKSSVMEMPVKEAKDKRSTGGYRQIQPKFH